MTAARYWRVRFWDSTGSNDIWLAEVEFLKDDYSVVIPTVPLASSVYGPPYSVAAAFDGIKATGDGWASSSKNCWIGGDFGTPVAIGSVVLYMAWQASAWDELPLLTSIAIDSSDDNINWTARNASASGSNVPGGVLTVVALSPPNTVSLRTSVGAAAPVGSHCTRGGLQVKTARDIEFGGSGLIWGTTKTKGIPNLPTKARVVLLHQRSKLPVRETWSDPTTGYFEFSGIDLGQQFLTLAEDAAGNFRPVAANRLTPEVLP